MNLSLTAVAPVERNYLAQLRVDYDSSSIRAMPRGGDRRVAAVAALANATHSTLAHLGPELQRLVGDGRVVSWRSIPQSGALLITMAGKPDGSEAEALRGIRELGLVVPADDGIPPGPVLPPQPSQEKTLGPELPWQLKAIQAPAAWEAGARGGGITIGFVDSGANIEHPMLRSHLRPGMGGGSGRANIDLLDGRPDVRDTYGHGTSVTSVALGSGSDGTIGVAPDATFLSARAFGRAPDGAAGNLATKLAGIAWMLAPTRVDGSGADPVAAPDIVNLSFGERAGRIEIFANVLRALEDAGVVVVAAAGNGGLRGAGSVLAPAVADTVLAAGMTNRDGHVDDRSAHDTPSSPSGAFKPDIVVPGVDVLGATADGGYATMTGTSFSSAITAGAAALVLSAAPNLVPSQVRDVLRRSAVDVGAPGADPAAGAGLVDVAAAVRLARSLQAGS